MTLLIVFLLLAIGVSFICSVSEAVLLSVRPSYVGTLDPNSGTARILGKQRENLDRPLAAILTANTIAHTIGAAGVGAQAIVVFGNEYLGVVSAVLTFLILVFSEIIPKTLGATYWQTLAPAFCRVILYMTYALYPLVWMSERVTRLIARKGESPFTFSRDEVHAMIEIGKEEGILDQHEHQIATNLMKLRHLSVRDIMTPRSVVTSFAKDETVASFFSSHADSPFSRIPVFNETPDHTTGYVLKSDLLIAQAKDEFDRTLSEFERECPVIMDDVSAADMYQQFIRSKSHIALITDKYGTIQGLITLEDVIETLIGIEIMDEMDKVEDLQKLAKNRWRQRMTAMGVNPDELSGNFQSNKKN